MKKCIQFLILSIPFLITACSVSEEEKQADIQRHRDSVAAAQAMIRAAQLATESRGNALNTINQEALKNDSVIRKDSIFKSMIDTNPDVQIDTTPAKTPVKDPAKTPAKPKAKTDEGKTTAKKGDNVKPASTKKTTSKADNKNKKSDKKK
jgi:hypothetical protein